jgi:hypothetical protein
VLVKQDASEILLVVEVRKSVPRSSPPSYDPGYLHISRRFVSLGVRHVDVGSLALLGSGDVSVAVARRRRDRLVRTAGTVRY